MIEPSIAEGRETVLAAARRVGAEVALVSHPATVVWLTGAEVDVETGLSPFGLAPLALVCPDGPVRVVASTDDAGAFDSACHDDLEVMTYEGFTTGPLRGHAAARELVHGIVGAGTTVAAELATLPAAIIAGGPRLVDVTRELARARTVKRPWEIERIQQAVRLCDAGQAALREALGQGRSEIELFGTVRGAMERAAGRRVPVLADLVSGPRTAAIGGGPTERRPVPGELVICDLAPRLRGYWADSCATLAVGEPTPVARRTHRMVAAVLERAVEAVRPGLHARDLDALMRAGLAYPHHSGHGVGGAYYEEPRIVPGADTVLEAGMVLALEPGHYTADHGVRLECVVLVTAGGCQVLSRHALDL
jgi:Xaa-Pro dipeptidase